MFMYINNYIYLGTLSATKKVVPRLSPAVFSNSGFLDASDASPIHETSFNDECKLKPVKYWILHCWLAKYSQNLQNSYHHCSFWIFTSSIDIWYKSATTEMAHVCYIYVYSEKIIHVNINFLHTSKMHVHYTKMWKSVACTHTELSNYIVHVLYNIVIYSKHYTHASITGICTYYTFHWSFISTSKSLISKSIHPFFAI